MHYRKIYTVAKPHFDFACYLEVFRWSTVLLCQPQLQICPHFGSYLYSKFLITFNLIYWKKVIFEHLIAH